MKSDSAACTSKVHSVACGIEVILPPGIQRITKGTCTGCLVRVSVRFRNDGEGRPPVIKTRVAMGTVRTHLKET